MTLEPRPTRARRRLTAAPRCEIPVCCRPSAGREPDGTEKCAAHTTWPPTDHDRRSEPR